MANTTTKDRITVHKAIVQLTTIHKGIAAAVVIVAAVIWIGIIKRMLHFGRTLDYSGLEALGIDHQLINQYNPFFWWTVVVVCSLLVTYLLLRFVQYTQRKARQKVVSQQHLRSLLPTLSPAAVAVLNWAWADRRHPITVGVLQHTAAQLGANRYRLICLAEEQDALLSSHLAPPATPTVTPPEGEEPLHFL